jgi:3-methyladenine DNA glycosylase/8-oxoguanine DNA glycosylase
MKTFTIVPRGPFSLVASVQFLEGFTPAAYTEPRSAADTALELAFPVEGSWRTAGVRVRQDAGDVTAEVVSPAAAGPELVAELRPQLERILSLDVDGSGFLAVGERDPVVGNVQQRYPGLRPVGFWSPYEAAAWTIIGLILLRGAGDPDAVPGQEPRLARAVALAYGLPGPATPEQLREISEQWRPYRTWVTVLLRIQLEYETGEITGRQGRARTVKVGLARGCV